MSPVTAADGGHGRPPSTRIAWCSSTRPGSRPTWRRCGAGRGERLVGKAPHGRWRTLTFLAALRGERIDAPCLFDGPINGQKFLACVERFLVPTLAPGDIVVLDNLGSHKGKAVRQAIQAAGAHRIFLPPYSPDLNPIEQAFAKLKHWLRQAQARSITELNLSLADILQRFPPEQCAAFFENSGYASA